MSRQTLSNLINDTSWKMSAVEFSVLEMLVKHRGKVLSIQELLQGMPVENRKVEILNEAIERICFYLEKRYACLIERVDDQGYVLHNKPSLNTGEFSATPFKSISKKHYSILIAQILLLIVLIYSFFEPAVDIKPENNQMLTTRSGSVAYFPSFNSVEQELIYSEQSSHFIGVVESCSVTPWRQIFLSVSSNDPQTGIISIVLRNDNAGEGAMKTLKIVPLDPQWHFIDKAWLKKVGICD
ncbi:helix-turn-helix domain-containing protein [uncultured Shewanella sp.]|uniref:helix-turn-helix domain-containing protein n=1 Tax=Shewanella atlantica TaxID=271099 RepID=UPI0026209BCF|nr:helix-turn-helix domain-containing protein [uncultured Shewanella sp.]